MRSNIVTTLSEHFAVHGKRVARPAYGRRRLQTSTEADRRAARVLQPCSCASRGRQAPYACKPQAWAQDRDASVSSWADTLHPVSRKSWLESKFDELRRYAHMEARLAAATHNRMVAALDSLIDVLTAQEAAE